MGVIWRSVGFQLFIGKQNILVDRSPIAWEKFKYRDLHQGFNWEHPILSRWREYFENLLNQVKATPTDTCDTIDFGKEEIFTLKEVVAAIQGLKSGKAAGKDKIRSKMLKALNGEGVRCLTRVCQVA